MFRIEPVDAGIKRLRAVHGIFRTVFHSRCADRGAEQAIAFAISSAREAPSGRCHTCSDQACPIDTLQRWHLESTTNFQDGCISLSSEHLRLRNPSVLLRRGCLELYEACAGGLSCLIRASCLRAPWPAAGAAQRGQTSMIQTSGCVIDISG